MAEMASGRGIHHARNAEQYDPLLQIRMRQLALPAGGRFPGRSHHAQSLARILFNLLFPVVQVERLQPVLGLLVLAKTEKDVRRTGD